MAENLASKYVELFYPRNDMPRTGDQPQAVLIDLIDVRAANRIRVTYDFGRDGYVVAMPTVAAFAAAVGDAEDEQWQEVAFIGAWATGEPD